MPDKVKYNIKNVHYAPKNDDGTYMTPVPIPGAVAATLEQQGELTPFWADGIKYYTSSSNGGYEGDLEVAMVPDSFRKDILGEVADKNNVLFENSNAITKEFALGFDIDTDKGVIKFWFYNCTATRPSIDAKTNEGTIEPNTDTLSISCASTSDGTVRAKANYEVNKTILDNWYKKVYLKDRDQTATNDAVDKGIVGEATVVE